MFHLNVLNHNKIHRSVYKLTFLTLILLCVLAPDKTLSEVYKPKDQINGSGLKIPRMVSLKDKLTYMRSGPGKEYPIILKFTEKGYPLKILAEFNNWRKVTTFDNVTGWIHTQLLSSFKTGLIITDTYLKFTPSQNSKSKAKLLENLLIHIIKCEIIWCKIEIVKEKKYSGWVKKRSVWGAIQK